MYSRVWKRGLLWLITQHHTYSFLPAALLFYQITPAKWRSYTLLIFSYLFFWSFSEKLIIYLIGTTFLTHHICIWMDTMDKRDKRKKRVLQVRNFFAFRNNFVSKVSKFFLWKCFEAGNGASYRLELSRSTDLFTNWNFFLYFPGVCPMWSMCTGERCRHSTISGICFCIFPFSHSWSQDLL